MPIKPRRRPITEIIKSIPEFDKKESYFLKERGGDFEPVHKERFNDRADPDVEKFLKFQREHGSAKGKVYSTHTHIDIPPLPGFGDIDALFQLYLNHNHTSMVISQIDSRYKAEAGRCHVMITKETKELLKEYNTPEKKRDFLKRFKIRLDEIYNRYKNDPVSGVYFFYNYCIKNLKLKFRFKALPGYKFNKEIFGFEKIYLNNNKNITDEEAFIQQLIDQGILK